MMAKFKYILIISSILTTQVNADRCFLGQTKANIQSCEIDEGFVAGARQVNLQFQDKIYQIQYESCQNELDDGVCSKAHIQINQGATLNAKSYLRDGNSQKIISDQQWNSTAYDCVKTTNQKIDICWK
ncbi:hypothetical protein BEN71_09985 [Acinetobacter wuhouensis]|uniref:Uncharacterized protein n=1 Tax=Acinetobacter wuhouensis TaxID=1879050 RepID=A0A385C4B2_9GAMM|nr:hypothetical protein [Acinetobacter wuhouensis]AXQ22384.1 hypothetical protein BEN71_09985 [Acinetobacter wuhouensis]AYO54339.1 hypothetical protein CDG68_12120 [Acinetobacter wuhouensis]